LQFLNISASEKAGDGRVQGCLQLNSVGDKAEKFTKATAV